MKSKVYASGCKDKGIRKFECVAMNQFLYFTLCLSRIPFMYFTFLLFPVIQHEIITWSTHIHSTTGTQSRIHIQSLLLEYRIHLVYFWSKINLYSLLLEQDPSVQFTPELESIHSLLMEQDPSIQFTPRVGSIYTVYSQSRIHLYSLLLEQDPYSLLLEQEPSIQFTPTLQFTPGTQSKIHQFSLLHLYIQLPGVKYVLNPRKYNI